MALLDAEAATAGDRAAVESGATWQELMERAAGHVARGVMDLAGRRYGLRVALIVGKGNNGGDGWGAARRLAEFGAFPRVVAVEGLQADMSDEAAANRSRYLAAGGRAGEKEELSDALAWCDVAVDCLLGTGATGAPRGAIGEAVNAFDRAAADNVAVVACDIPTGVQGDDGLVPGEAVRADLTVTLGGLKRGLLLHPGATYAGRVLVGELGSHYEPPEVAWSALTAAGAAPSLLPAATDKRDRGVVLVVAGSVGMVGAAILCARGALAAGAGLVTVAVPRPVQDIVAGALPPAMTLGLDEQEGAFSPSSADVIADQAERSDVVVAGPGMRHDRGPREVVDALLGRARRLVLDADALNVYRGEGDALADHAGELVLTPQSRELARITPDVDEEDAWERRVEIAPELAARYRATVVAKGPGTVVAAPDGRAWVTPTGGPALGAGGSGDVLAGALAATVANADDVPLAVAKACWCHGLAGDLVGLDTADRSTSAALADVLPSALALAADLARRRPDWPFDPPGWSADRPPPEEWS
ncbi:MAG: NAD(P)H-hydrate dehydratase [Actinomycetota bacterium]|nr:NAD(P)H-hydrate dehydratase [Actinomycetota bacterium]